MPSVPREKYPEMNWRAADKVAAWKVFKRRMEVVFMADQIPEERQWALILVAGGDKAYNRWDTLEDTVQDRKKVEQVWKAFEKSFEQSTSFWHFRDTYLADFRQDESETMADLDLRIKQTVRDNPVTSTVSIPPRRQPGRDTSTRNRRDFKLNVTDPDLLIPIKQTAVTKRHSDLREPQPSSSDSQPASSQPVLETTTSESSVSLPSSQSGSSSTESTSTSGTDSSSSETSSESSSQPSSNASSPETSSSASTSRSTSPELLEMECSFNSLLAGTRDHQSHPVTRSQMDNLRDQQQRIAILKQVASQPQNQPRPVSVPPVANMPLPPYPRRRPSDKGSKNQVQADNANAPRKSSDSETDRLQDIQEEPRRRIGPSRVKELAKFFMPTSDEEKNSRVNNRTRCKKLFEPKKEEESEK